MLDFISDTAHYDIVLNLATQAKRSLWIGTADIKDLHVKKGTAAVPFLTVLSELIRRKVEIRLIYAKRPGQPFQEDLNRQPAKRPGQPFQEDLNRQPLLKRHLEQVLCPRVHFKIILIDSRIAYIGSANLTGAGMGMKSPFRRNFEAGILTDDPAILNAAIEEFDKIWRGAECPRCQRKAFCPSPIA